MDSVDPEFKDSKAGMAYFCFTLFEAPVPDLKVGRLTHLPVWQLVLAVKWAPNSSPCVFITWPGLPHSMVACPRVSIPEMESEAGATSVL